MYKNKLAYTTASTNSLINAVGTFTTYTYSSSSWGDLLTKYGGTSISYDAIGNPTNWRGASKLTWNGRTLNSITLTDGSMLSFEYNTAGIRTRKSVDASGITTEYTYILDGTKVVAERKSGSVFIEYFYDDTGSVVGCKYGKYGTQEYYFQKNLQGDIIRIVNSIGVIVVEYTYDAWGNILSITGSSADTVGQANSFRYRGYFYDTETGLYYLNSRYYDPVVGRFISPDNSAVLTAAPTALTDKNLYAYCDNNPVVRTDNGGQFWFVTALIGVASQYVSDVVENIMDGKTGVDIIVPKSTVGDYIAAGVTALIPGSKVINALSRSVVTEGIKYIEREINGEGNNFGESVVNIFAGTVFDKVVDIGTKKINNYIKSFDPINYSQYANKLRLHNPNLTKDQISSRLKKVSRTNYYVRESIEFISSLL